MEKPEARPPDSQPGKQKFFSGTRGLLASIVLVALGLGWLAHAHRQAERRTVLVAELARFGVHPFMNEMTYLAEIVKKFWPRREAWLRGQIGAGWFDRPVLFDGDIDDDRVPEIARRFRELGTVVEVHYDGDHLTEAGIAALRAGLPGVNVVPNFPTTSHRCYLSSWGVRMAYGALGFAIAVATTLLGLLVLTVRWLVRRLRAAGSALAPSEPVLP